MDILRKSLKYKLFFAICIISLIFISLFSILYLLFYDDYVLLQTKKMLFNAYDLVAERYDGSFDSVYGILEGFDYRYGIKATIINRNFTIEFSTGQPKIVQMHNSSAMPRPNISDLILDSVTKGEPSFTQFFDSSSGTDFLLLSGVLESENILSLRASLPLIEENAKNTGLFMLGAGAFALFICFILAYGFSVRITRPLLEINSIAKAMTTLDFSRKYKGGAKDEVGQLGQSINSLSGQLETTIGRLQETNRQLEKEIAKERNIDEMRKNFIINVSHELKTPLALVQGYAEGLKLNISGKEEDKNFYCDVIMEESARMAKLVQQLLGLSKIEVGKIQPEREKIELSAMVSAVLSKNALLFENKNIRFNNTLPLTIINADLDMLEQVLVNFLTNAVNHSPEEGEIIIRREIRGDKVRLFIYNKGDKIPPGELKDIWLSFYKVDKARTRVYGGTGIGLSVVRAIMDAHGNGYGVENKESGVEFWTDWDYITEED